MTTRRSLLLAGTGTLTTAFLGCGGGSGTASAANEASATPLATIPAPAPPINLTGGRVRQLGTQTLAAFLNDARSALPEGRASADRRMLPSTGQTAYCGAVIWRNKYSLGVSGGHSASYDDGHYVQDLTTGAWEMLLPPSTEGSPSRAADAYGEWLPNRPAAQHSGAHQVTVGDDIVQAVGYSIGYTGRASGQAHRWNGAAGAWERYGNHRPTASTVHSAFYDHRRRRIVLFESQTTRTVHVIAASNPAATWSSVRIPDFGSAGLYQSIGYHDALDCYVLLDQRLARGRLWIMPADDISRGWIEVAVQGEAAYPMIWAGLEYVPPMQALAAANMEEANTMYYLAPKGERFDSWAWYRETYTGPAPAAAWEMSRGTLDAPQTRVKWSSQLNALVMLKSPGALTEVFVPSALPMGS